MRTTLLILSAASLLFLACGKPSKSASHKVAPAARIENAVPEARLGIVVLTEKAVSRLGIETKKVEKRDVSVSRTLPGEAILPTNASVEISAPFTSEVSSFDPTIMRPLGRVSRGQEVMGLTPLLSPEREVLTKPERIAIAAKTVDLEVLKTTAEADLRRARAVVDGVKVRLIRAQTLRGESVSIGEIEKIQAELAVAEAAYRVIKQRDELLSKVSLDAKAGELKQLNIESPSAGFIQEIRVSSKQKVSAGTPLFTIVNDSELWLRVPVFTGDLAALDLNASAEIARVGQKDETAVVKPMTGPPTANPEASTVHLFYKLGNTDFRHRLGERFAVSIPEKKKTARLIVPWSALIHDFDGGTWVYEALGDNKFSRLRVDLDRKIGEEAVLKRGPQEGTTIVISAVAELFGTEFGVGK